MKYRIIFLIFAFCSSLYAIDKDLICKYLYDDLLTKRDVYYASHLLMIPLEYSFQENDKKLLNCGVGSFDCGINSLKSAPFFETLEKEVLENKKPILGICLGMQLLTNSSEEGKEKGLGWIDASTVKFDLEDKSLSIPHMGWNKTNPTNTNNIFKNFEDNRFYFVHSYHVVCKDEKNILATAHYGQTFTCSISKDNIYGVQFHPEKSHKFGMQLLKNFGEI